jgi:hypothetical protein
MVRLRGGYGSMSGRKGTLLPLFRRISEEQSLAGLVVAGVGGEITPRFSLERRDDTGAKTEQLLSDATSFLLF